MILSNKKNLYNLRTKKAKYKNKPNRRLFGSIVSQNTS